MPRRREGDPDVEAENNAAAPPPSGTAASPAGEADAETHFRPTGTVAVLAVFIVTLILLWLSVYLILIARGVTV